MMEPRSTTVAGDEYWLVAGPRVDTLGWQENWPHKSSTPEELALVFICLIGAVGTAFYGLSLFLVRRSSKARHSFESFNDFSGSN
jgi:hypothetical protein